jgi:eight transmembrane protein EpsH (proposed exosortase)
MLFGLWLIGSVLVSWNAVQSLLRYSLGNDDASHILLIPIISASLIYLDRKQIFRQQSYGVAVFAFPLLLGAIFLFWSSRSNPPSPSACALGLALLWVAGFALAFGSEALKRARFPLMFLLLFVPLPEEVLGKVVYFLQKGSADLSALFFNLTPLPVLREGFVFHLPRFSIEVARECSGIRSSIALLVLAVLVGHFFLRGLWRQITFVLAGIVVMIIKNGVRIVTLTLLANYVDPGFLHGNLHHEGGVVFFVIGLLLLLPVFWLLQRGENPANTRAVKLTAEAL